MRKFIEKLSLALAHVFLPDGYEIKMRGIGAKLFTESVMEQERDAVKNLKFR